MHLSAFVRHVGVHSSQNRCAVVDRYHEFAQMHRGTVTEIICTVTKPVGGYRVAGRVSSICQRLSVPV